MILRFKKVLLLFIISAPIWAHAQDGHDLENFLEAGPADASKLMSAYLNPVIEGLSYGFNGGWYTTAKAHKTLGFDVSVSVNAVFIPSSKNYFRPADLNLQVAQLISPASGNAPTIAGPEDASRYRVNLNNGSLPDPEFGGPEGLDFEETFKVSGTVSPTAQIGLGIYKNTDLKVRWIPEVQSGSTKIKLFGVGVMHDIKQHIPGIKVLPFDLSVVVAYTNIKGVTPMVDPALPPISGDTSPQEMTYNMNAWLFQAIISKKLALFTFHGGFGYNTIATDSDVLGSYVLPGYPQGVRNPVSLRFKNNSMRLSGGIRLNLGPIYLNGEYTVQEYSTVSVGFGVTVR